METQVDQVNIQKVIALSGLPKWKIKNIYLYGSRIYGTHKISSDYDIMVVASTLEPKEIKDPEYNIHIKTTDFFYDSLTNYKMVALECVFAPPSAIFKETFDYRKDFLIKDGKLKKSVLSQSHDSWMKGKFKINDGDITRGTKSLFHSIRMLMFAIQLIENGKITDFSEANKHWEAIDSSDLLQWNKYKDLLLPLKQKMENRLIEATRR